jgi:peptide/nickel transport system substrate-binding protein
VTSTPGPWAGQRGCSSGRFPTASRTSNWPGRRRQHRFLRRARDPAAAKKKLAEAGYGGEPIVVVTAPTELAGIRALSLIGADQLRRSGLNVDLQEMEFGTIVKRRTSQSPPDEGGWNIFFTMIRSLDPEHPPVWQSGAAGRRQGRLWRLAWQPAHRRTAPRLARCRRCCGATAHRRRIANAGVAGRAIWQTTAYRKELIGIIPGGFRVFYNIKHA